MGSPLNEHASAKSYKDAICDMGYIFYKRFCHVYYFIDFIFNLSPLGRKQKQYLQIVHSFTKKVIKERKEYREKNKIDYDDTDGNDETYVYNKKKRTAMLDLLIQAEKEGLIDKTGIQEEVDTFMFEVCN